MKTIRFLVVTVIVASSFFLSSCSKEKELLGDLATDSPKPFTQDEVEHFLNEYLSEKAEILITGKIPETFCPKFESNDECRKVADAILDRRSFLSGVGFSYLEYNGKVSISELETSDHVSFQVGAYEYSELKTNDVDIVEGQAIITKEQLPFRALLKNVGGVLKLVSEERIHDYQNADSDGTSTNAPLSGMLDYEPGSSKTQYTYNKTTAKNYAVQWVGSLTSPMSSTGYNPAYRSYSPTDCANFISQCLANGGWSFRNAYSTPTATGSWWYSNNNNTGDTYSWKKAHALNAFVNFTGRGVLKNNVLDLGIGDIVFANWISDWTNCTCDSEWDHAMIITSLGTNTVYLTYHSNNRLNKNFYDFIYDSRCLKNGVYTSPNLNRWRLNTSG